MHLNWEDYDEPTRKRIAANNPDLQALLEEWKTQQVHMSPEGMEEHLKEYMIQTRKRMKKIMKDLNSGKWKENKDCTI